MLVKELMSTRVESIGPDTTAQECARMMRKMDIGSLPVWENGQIIGVVTDRDICCRAVGDDKDPATVPAKDIMSREITSCYAEDDCDDAGRLMKQKRLRRLAVLDREKKMVGLLSVDDLARYSHELAGEVLEAAAPWPH